MDKREAYAALGLLPPNIYMSEQPHDARQRIGASTTMLVEAALTMLNGQSVLLQGRNLSHAVSLHRTCQNYHHRLFMVMHDRVPSVKTQKPRKVVFEDPDIMMMATSSASRQPDPCLHDFVLFDDLLWHSRAIQRMRDPLSRIRFLRYDPQGWHAFDIQGTYIALLTEACGNRLLREYPMHILIADV